MQINALQWPRIHLLKQHAVLVILCTLLMIASFLRIIGNHNSYHEDDFTVIEKAQHMLTNESLNPGFYVHPNHTSIYSSYFTYKMLISSEAYTAKSLPYRQVSNTIWRLWAHSQYYLCF